MSKIRAGTRSCVENNSWFGVILNNMELNEALCFNGSLEWRKWLSQNHDKEKAVWLIHYKKHSGKPSLNYNEALEEAICFGWIDGKMKGVDGERFILRYSPRRPKSVWSKINREKAEKLIEAGRMTDAGLAKIEEAKKSGYWDNAYTNKRKEEMPSDLKKALVEDVTAWDNFHNFANSYRNMYIGWVNSARTEETRKRRITEVVKRSHINKKPGIE
ncbi:MAG: YdeI/OmpD-associated family protein [Candidatus Micrarchaeota archaeon]